MGAGAVPGAALKFPGENTGVVTGTISNDGFGLHESGVGGRLRNAKLCGTTGGKFVKYHVTIKPKPHTIVIETMSGPDVAEEMARQQFAARIKGLHQDGTLPIHDADHSKAVVVHVETFPTLAQLEAQHGWSGAMGVYAGPIHNHGQKFIQTYIGQHEWLAINVDDPTDIRRDPGYVAKIFGYGIVLLSKDEWLYANDKALVDPEAEHPSILQDEILFNPKEVVEGYLGKKISDLDVH